MIECAHCKRTIQSGIAREIKSSKGTKYLCDKCLNSIKKSLLRGLLLYAEGFDLEIHPICNGTEYSRKCVEYRQHHNMTQEQLANKIGVSRWTIINFELGKSVSSRTFDMILSAVGEG